MSKTVGDPVPALSRHLVAGRDNGLCFRCGQTQGTDFHHRRGRAVKDEHTHCPCNGVWLCRGCHGKCHAWPAEAREHGWIVTRWNPNPGDQPVKHWTRQTVLLFCDGSVGKEENPPSGGP